MEQLIALHQPSSAPMALELLRDRLPEVIDGLRQRRPLIVAAVRTCVANLTVEDWRADPRTCRELVNWLPE